MGRRQEATKRTSQRPLGHVLPKQFPEAQVDACRGGSHAPASYLALSSSGFRGLLAGYGVSFPSCFIGTACEAMRGPLRGRMQAVLPKGNEMSALQESDAAGFYDSLRYLDLNLANFNDLSQHQFSPFHAPRH